jgi:plasmid maintenance system killer protein
MSGLRKKERFLSSYWSAKIGSTLKDNLQAILLKTDALIAAPNMDCLQGPCGWRIHQLIGDRVGTWSISVSGNWRITFITEGETIRDLDLEDYH